MKRDPLIQLLLAADASAPAPRRRPDLAAALVQDRARRPAGRSGALRGLTALAAAALLALVVWPGNSPRPSAGEASGAGHGDTTARVHATPATGDRPTLTGTPPAGADMAINARSDADLRLAAVRRAVALLDAERKAAAAARAGPAPPRVPLELVLAEQLEAAAGVLVQDAARLEEQYGEAAARLGYETAAELYPRTAWAAVARRELARLDADEPMQ